MHTIQAHVSVCATAALIIIEIVKLEQLHTRTSKHLRKTSRYSFIVQYVVLFAYEGVLMHLIFDLMHVSLKRLEQLICL